jgi:UDP-sugar pyrophosphorylase
MTPFNGNLQLVKDALGDEHAALLTLLQADQQHLFAHWAPPGTDDAEKKAMCASLATLDSQYPGGLATYCANAKQLLADSAADVNPYAGYTPTVPSGEKLTCGDAAFAAAEAVGVDHIGELAFCLVAGGLGERLGYNGIKVELPTELVTETPYLGLYCQFILALQARARKQGGANADVVIPLAIMTSGDTNAKTIALLKANNDFGMAEGQITIVKQELVPAIADNSGAFVLSPSTYGVECKPHGHGDVHTLLHQAGLPAKWAAAGKRWLLFFQDTNAQVFRALVAVLGVSVGNAFAVNTLTVPRRPGEPVGAICQLQRDADGATMTVNVEYNQLSALMSSVAADSPARDTPDAVTGFAPYPGNTNALLYHIPQYAAVLAKTNGAIPEFVNPKYKDAEKTVFKKPTRLECMMQDYPKLLLGGGVGGNGDTDNRIGFTQLERWVSFSAVKNNTVDAAAKQKQTGFAESACMGEADIYYCGRRLLKQAGGDAVDIDVEGGNAVYAGINTQVGAKVVFMPSFGVSTAELRERVCKATSFKVSARSSLVVDGDVTFAGDVDIDGSVVIRAVAGASVRVTKLVVHNDGDEFAAIADGDADVAEKYAIRGYTLNAKATQTFEFNEPGEFEISTDDSSKL